MLTEFRVKNLRSLKDTGTVKLSPITILLGENSSGKSTFLRAFPLLKQSAETTTRSSILWFGKYVDFGDFDQALIRKQGEKEIVFSFGLTVPEQISKGDGFIFKYCSEKQITPPLFSIFPMHEYHLKNT